MSERGDLQRPTAVSVIGWIWLVFAGYLLLRSLFDLVAWRVLAPLRPTLLAAFPATAPGLERLSALFEYISVFHAAKAVFAAFTVVAAWRLLGLREWARVGMQVVGWIELAYVLGFAAFWMWLWPRVAAAKARDPQFTAHSYGTLGLIGGLAVCGLLAAALVLQIAVLRTSRVRASFRRGGGAAAAGANRD